MRIILLLALMLAQPLLAQDWSVWGANKAGTRFSPLTQINADNVDELEVAWQYRTGVVERYPLEANENAGFQVNPILLPASAGRHLVVCTPFNQIIALDPVTGAERWVYDPDYTLHGYGSDEDPEGADSAPYYKCRGVSFWIDSRVQDASSLCASRIFAATNELQLIALDARTGKLCPGFGQGGIVDVSTTAMQKKPTWPGEVRFYNPPTIINDKLIVGTSVRDNHRWNAPSGAIRSFDARSGKMLWEFDPIPRDESDPQYAQWTTESAATTGAGNMWGMAAADEERDLVFIPTSGPSPDFYGGNRPGDNRYSDSIVALRGATGQVVWHFQLIHHDVWDYDVGAQPVLVELEKAGKAFPAVIQATKTGMIYIFHRETGEPYFPIEERAVPQDGVPGEQLSPTQPFPVLPPPLVRQGVSKEDLWGVTSYDRGKCEEQYGNARFGPIFTPPSLEGTIVVPATAGGVNWGSVAVDPDSKTLVTNVLNMAHFVQLMPNGKNTGIPDSGASIMDKFVPLLGTPYMLKQRPVMSPFYTPCLEPPWAKLVAVDLESGAIKWESTLGTLDKLAPLPIPINWGTPTFGGPMVTAGGLVFIGATADNRLRAFDVGNGEELWNAQLPTGAFAHPMTYEIDAKQYVVIAAGGHPFVFRRPGDYITAFALPQKRDWWRSLMEFFR